MKNNNKSSSIYSNGEYLNNNKNWHVEDSPYKVNFVLKAIQQNKIEFSNCADVGCGAGLIIEILSEHFPKASFTGYDLSDDVIEIWNSRKINSNLNYQKSNILLEEKYFDLIICLDVIEHIEDYYSFLRNIRLKGDNFIFNIPLDMNVMKILTPGIRLAREEVGHIHYFNVYTAIKSLEDCGFTIVESQLSMAFLSIAPRNFRQFLALPFRFFSLIFGKRLSVKLFGGASLVIYAK